MGVLDDLIECRGDLRVRNLLPATDRDEFNSSIESTISTPLIRWKIRTSSHLVSESYFPTKTDDGVGNLSNCISDICCLCGPTIELCGISTGMKKFHGRRPACECRHWDFVFSLFVISHEKCPRPVACGTGPRSLGGAQG